MAMSKKDFTRIADALRVNLRAIESLPETVQFEALATFHGIKQSIITACHESNIHFSREKFDAHVLEFQYIGYVQREMPGDQSFKLQRFRSDAEALDYVRELERATGDQWCVSLYGYSTEDWWIAKDFESTGCPFDYPWKVSERGPRGGLKLVNA